MKLLFKVLAIGLLPSICTAKEGTPTASGNQQSRGLFFSENKGQIVDQNHKQRNDIDFNISSKNFSVFFGDGQVHYQFTRVENEAEIKAHEEKSLRDRAEREKDVIPKLAVHRVDVELIGANKDAEAITDGRQAYYEMYYNEFTPESGARVNTFEKVTYKNVYPNIDWVLYTRNGAFKYEFIVHPGGDPSVIKMRYSGATALGVTGKGELEVGTQLGKIVDAAPYSTDATGKQVASSFSLNGDVLSYNIGSYEGTLTIDPTVSWGTYYGGPSTDYTYGVVSTPDGTGVYSGGYSISSSNLGTTGSHQQFISTSYDAFLVKFDAAGARVWGTYYGGTGSIDYCYGTGIDGMGNVCIGGRTNTTSGTAIATSGSAQPTHGGSTYDAWIAVFNSSGVRQWGTYCGGSSTDYGYGVCGDAFGNFFLCGYTSSSNNMTTPFAAQPSIFGTPEGFLEKYNSTGARVWGTYCGGGSTDEAYACAADASGNVYLTGITYGFITGFGITTGAHQTTVNGLDAYLIKYSAAQGTILWGTYKGGTSSEYGYGVTTDANKNVYLLGYTTSSSGISTTNGYQTTFGGVSDLFVGKFDSAGTAAWFTYYGGSSDEYTTFGNGLSVDLNDNVYISGYTYSSSGIASNGIYNSLSAGPDICLAKLNPDQTLGWGTYYGGNSTDVAYGIWSDMVGNVYLSGYSYSTNNIATSGGFMPNYNCCSPDGIVVKIQDCPLPPMPGTITGNTTVCQGSTQTYSVASVTGATTYQWILPSGWTGTSTTNTITVTPSATSGQVKVKAGVSCGYGPARTLNVNVLAAPPATITPSGPTTFCNGSNVTLNANTGTGYSYVWKQGTTTLGTTTNSHVAATSGNYTVEITNSNNCTTTSSAAVVVVNPNPIINFPSLPATCTNNPNVTLNATPTGGTYTGAGVTGNILNPSNAGPGIHTIVYSYTDSNTCTSSGNQSVTVNPAPTVSLPSFSTICSDVIVPLNMAIPPGGVYTGTGVTGSNFSPYVSGIGTFNITYTYTDGNNCTAAQTQPITVNPLTATNFPSITPKCIDAPIVNLTATPLGGTFSGPGVSGNQFNPGTGAGNHIVHYDYTNQYNCTTHDSETIVVNALPTLTFPAMDSVCNNAPITMLASPTGGTYTGPGTGMGNQLNTTQAGVGMHTITYTYTDANTCTNSTQQTVLVQPAPVINSQPFLYIEICEGEALAVNVGASNVGTYQWQQNSVNVAGAQASTYVVGSAIPANSGNYQVIITGTGACATTTLVSSSSAVLVNPLPPVNLTPGSDTICSGDTMILNSGLSGNFNYQWKLNGNNITGATMPTLAVATPGVYRVFVTNQNSGCNVNSPNAVIGVNPSPDATISYTGPTIFCDGDNLAIATNDTTNAMTYQWTNNGNNVNGANAATYSATMSGQYRVVMTNSYLCSRTSDSVDVTVNPLPTPTITVLDAFGNMTTGTYTYYQWNMGTTPIPGANGQSYQATQPGSYTVTVRDTNGCENTSPVKIPLGVSNVVNGSSSFVLYPNPNTGTFVIDGTLTSTDGKASLEIVDATGKLVYREEVKMVADKLNKQVDVSNVASGAYMIRIVSDNAREVIPFVKR